MGIRRKVLDKSVAPTNWRSFLRLDQNKTELFRYLSTTIIQHGDRGDVIMICVYDDTCISSSNELDLSNLTPCNHEDADTRVFLHVKDMKNRVTEKWLFEQWTQMYWYLLYRCMSSYKRRWKNCGLTSVLEKIKFFPIHEILEHIGECKARGLPFFHAFTG